MQSNIPNKSSIRTSIIQKSNLQVNTPKNQKNILNQINSKPYKEYQVVVLQDSLYKKKFEYRNKDKFLKILRITISDESVIKITNFEIDNLNTLEIPAESSITIHITIQASKKCDIYMQFIRYDTDQIEEELLFRIDLK